MKKLAINFMRTSKFVLVSAAVVATCAPGVAAQAKQRAQRPSKEEQQRNEKLKNEVKVGVRLPFISDVRVIPSASNAVISFKSSQRTVPLVEVGRVRPQPDRHGVLTFALGNSVFSRFVQLQDGRYTLNFNATNEQLDAGTTYYYIINVFNDNQNDPLRKREQETGEISTFSQTVKVVWERILIIDDSDDFGAGEISFWFWVNYGQPGAQSGGINNLGKSTGESYRMRWEHLVENAPNDLSLSVSGIDDDTGVLSGVARGTKPGEPLSGPGKDANYEYNVARNTIDLTRFPSEVGETRSEPFKLVSMPNGRTLGNLSFEVYGHFEITRRTR